MASTFGDDSDSQIVMMKFACGTAKLMIPIELDGSTSFFIVTLPGINNHFGGSHGEIRIGFKDQTDGGRIHFMATIFASGVIKFNRDCYLLNVNSEKVIVPECVPDESTVSIGVSIPSAHERILTVGSFVIKINVHTILPLNMVTIEGTDLTIRDIPDAYRQGFRTGARRDDRCSDSDNDSRPDSDNESCSGTGDKVGSSGRYNGDRRRDRSEGSGRRRYDDRSEGSGRRHDKGEGKRTEDRDVPGRRTRRDSHGERAGRCAL